MLPSALWVAVLFSEEKNKPRRRKGAEEALRLCASAITCL